MTRVYIQPSWINAAEDHAEWSGGNDQYRGDRSVDISTFDKNGRARVEAFSDSAIESLKKRKTSIPLADRILPQAKRVRLLTEQLYELEAERKNGMNLAIYSQLRDILICKRNRAEELLKKAITIKPPVEDWEDISYNEQTAYYTEDSTYTNDDSGQRDSSTWLGGISEENTFKSSIKVALHLTRKLVEFKHKVKAYYQTLKEV